MSNQEGIMVVDDARKILGIHTEFDAKKVFDCFDAEVWVKTENEETDSIPDIIAAKNILLHNLIEQQIKKTGRFDIKAPWDDRCDRCKGTQEIYKLEKKEIEISCYDCRGNGSVLKKCPTCHGSTRYKRSEPGLKLNLRCKVCDDDGKAQVKCRTCRGHKKIKKAVNTGKIASTTPCKACKNTMGRTPTKKEKVPFNPPRGLEAQLGAAILEAADET